MYVICLDLKKKERKKILQDPFKIREILEPGLIHSSIGVTGDPFDGGPRIFVAGGNRVNRVGIQPTK